ncbi:hypothetical protein [Rhizobium leguminosarum]|uniref:hypothetical protein n=1 Tax=Rhizobium leguminosarum TaxID=384 RepID=UPI0016153994|nr:hypothetical protein [Rhizobium leguminosarum]MBB4327821.1 hypothetical protein [Rhizobium leguminosarum]MBB4353486.1 hypothetical protein [Rhizobium leguminosarum]MBB4548435.1 hypothetical protein [Rhizobium leguminosarum]MBB4561450.1 hypothetical protein [Rhizobium leguminosarum]
MKALVLGIAVASIAMAARADQPDPTLVAMLGTIQVSSQPYMVEGKLSGCQYVYAALVQDWVYRKGQFLKVDGSIAFMDIGGSFGTTLKVVVNEVTVSPDGTFKFTPAPPSRAYLIGSDYSTNLDGLVQATPSDTPGALFSIFRPESTLNILKEAAETNKTTVAFNRASGGSDILMPLELDVSDTLPNGQKVRSSEAGLNFAKCIQALLKDKR